MKAILSLILMFATSVSLAAGPKATDAKQDGKKRTPASTTFKVHPCEQDAIAKAGLLIRLHFSGDSNATDIQNLDIEQTVKLEKPVKLPVGKGSADVLGVTAYIYRATYDMKFKYAQIKGTCALMGQEIIELSDPY